MRSIELHSQRSWARLSLGRHQIRDADRDPREVDADERTEQVLQRLPASDWSVVGHYEQRSGKTSQVVVGGGGIYLISACKPDGCVRVKDGVPWSRRSDSRSERPHTDINRKVLEPAQALERQIRARSPHCPPVHAVVVLWSEFPQRVAETSRISFVHGRDLAGWLRQRGSELDPAGRADVAEIVSHIAAAGTRRTLRPSRHLRAA